MNTKKLNFSEMKNALSRSEMKNIMAGSGSCNIDCTGCSQYKCTSGCTSSGTDSSNRPYVTCGGTTHTCSAYPGCWN